jgi:hypothetical protein
MKKYDVRAARNRPACHNLLLTSCSSWQPVTTNVPDRVRLTTTDSQRIELRQAVAWAIQ